MKTEKEVKTKPARKTRKVILITITALIVVLIVAILLLVPAYISSEKGRQMILAKINNAIDGHTDIGNISMGWSKGIRLTDISFEDTLGQTSATVKQISTKPFYSSILTGSLAFGETIIDQPKVQIVLGEKKPKKTDTPHASEQKTTEKVIVLPIKKIDTTINKGSLKVTSHTGSSIELADIKSHINLQKSGRHINFDTNMTVLAQNSKSNIKAKGSGWNLKGTRGQLAVEVDDLDLGSLGPLFELIGVDVQTEGTLSANIESQIKDGSLDNITANINGKNLDVAAAKLKGDRFQTADLEILIKLIGQKELIKIEDCRIEADWLNASAKGIVPTTIDSFTEFLNADSRYDLNVIFDCDVAKAASQIPNLLSLKKGIKIDSGKLSGNIETLSRNQQKEILAQASLADLAGKIEGKTVALKEPLKAKANITSDKNQLKFEQLQLTSSFADVDMAGTIESLNYNIDIDLSKLQRELGQFIDMAGYKTAGQLSEKGALSISKEKITASGSSVVKNFLLTSKQGLTIAEPNAEITFAVAAQPEKKICKVDSIKLISTFGTFDIKDTIIPFSSQAQAPLNLSIAAGNIDLDKLKPFAVMFASFPQDIGLAGIAQTNLSISSEKDTYYLKADKTKIKNLKLTSAGKEPFEQNEISLLAEGKINPVKKTYALQWTLLSPDIKSTGNIEKDDKGDISKINGKADLEYDWVAVSSAASAFMPTGLKLQGQRKDKIVFSSEYPVGREEKLLANLNTKAALGFDKAQYMGLNFDTTEMPVKFKQGVFTVGPVSTTVNQGKFNFESKADFTNQRVLLQTPQPIDIIKDVQITDEMARELLKFLNPIFSNAVGVTGIANFQCDKLAIPLRGADQKDIEVIGTVSIQQLQLRPTGLIGQLISVAKITEPVQEITIHPTKFTLTDGQLSYENMQVDIGSNPFNFAGVIGLDEKLDMNVTLPLSVSLKRIRTGEETSEKRIILPLGGTISKPELDLTNLGMQLLEGQLQEQLGDKIKEQVGEEIGDKAREVLEDLFK